MSQPLDYMRKRELEGDFARLDLESEIDTLRDQAEETGIGGKTLAKVSGLSVLLVVLKEGHELEEHAVEGPAFVQVLDGRLELRTEQETINAGSNSGLVLRPGLPHDARALDDTTLLITFNRETA